MNGFGQLYLLSGDSILPRVARIEVDDVAVGILYFEGRFAVGRSKKWGNRET